MFYIFSPLFRICLPHLHRPITAGRGNVTAIGGPGEAVDLALVMTEAGNLLTIGRVPDIHYPIAAARGHKRSRRGPGEGGD